MGTKLKVKNHLVMGGGLLTTISPHIAEFIYGSEQPKTSLVGAVI